MSRKNGKSMSQMASAEEIFDEFVDTGAEGRHVLDIPQEHGAEWPYVVKSQVVQEVIRMVTADDDTDLSDRAQHGHGQFTVRQLFDACERMDVPVTLKEVRKIVKSLDEQILTHEKGAKTYRYNFARWEREAQERAVLAARFPEWYTAYAG